MQRHGSYHIFHAWYLEPVRALYEIGASRYGFCVDIDLVVAALLLATLWKDYRSGEMTAEQLEVAAFTVFLFGRMTSRAIVREQGDRRCPLVPGGTAGGTLIDSGEASRTAPDISWPRHTE